MKRPCSNNASQFGHLNASTTSNPSIPHGKGIPHFGQAESGFSGFDSPASAGLLFRNAQIGEWHLVQTISRPVRPSDSSKLFSYSTTALQWPQYTNLVAVENARSKIPGKISSAR